MEDCISNFWTTDDGMPDGGHASGIGYAIAWQRGPLSAGRNGAFLIEVLQSCLLQLQQYEGTPLDSTENKTARDHLTQCIESLESRKQRRQDEGTFGEQIPDKDTIGEFGS